MAGGGPRPSLVHSTLQPDLVLLRPRGDGYRSALPGPEDVLLVVEVADSSLGYDRDVKGPLYAAHGVPEYWLVDLAGRCVVRHREPVADGYRQVDAPLNAGSLAPAKLPQAKLDLGELPG